jgi:hypothetical protein
MSHVRARASEHAYHAQRYHNINEFCGLFSTISKKRPIVYHRDPIPDYILYCHAHIHVFQDKLTGRALRTRRLKFSGHLCISVLRNAVDVKQELH